MSVLSRASSDHRPSPSKPNVAGAAGTTDTSPPLARKQPDSPGSISGSDNRAAHRGKSAPAGGGVDAHRDPAALRDRALFMAHRGSQPSTPALREKVLAGHSRHRRNRQDADPSHRKFDDG
jgi:hypothetical protein